MGSSGSGIFDYEVCLLLALHYNEYGAVGSCACTIITKATFVPEGFV